MKKYPIFILVLTAMLFPITVVRTPADKSYEDKVLFSFSETKDIFSDPGPIIYELWYYNTSGSNWTQTLPSWLSAADSTGSYHFSGTTPYVCSDTPYTLQFRGFNTALDSAVVAFDINVENENQAPVILEDSLYFSELEMNPFENYKLSLCFTDDYPDGQNGRTNLNYRIEGYTPTWLEFDSLSGKFYGTVPYRQCSENFIFTAFAKDTCGSEVSINVTFRAVQSQLHSYDIDYVYKKRGENFYFKIPNPFYDCIGATVTTLRPTFPEYELPPEWIDWEITDNYDSVAFWGISYSCSEYLLIEMEGKTTCYSICLAPFYLHIEDLVPLLNNPNSSLQYRPESAISFYLNENSFKDDIENIDSLEITANLKNDTVLPSWLLFERDSLYFHGTAPDVCDEVYYIEVWAEDHCGGRVNDEFEILVKNATPVVCNPIPEQAVISGTSWTYTFPSDVFLTEDELPVTIYEAYEDGTTSLPYWMNFNSSTRTFSGTPPAWQESWSIELKGLTACSSSASTYFNVNADEAGNFFSGGTGVSSNPYLIYNFDQLNNMRALNYTSGKYFKLMSDINFSGRIWEPVALNNFTFRNHFNGNNKKLLNLTMERDVANAGLFGRIENSQIKNITLENFNIQGLTKSGTLVGTVSGNSTVRNIKASGTVEIKQTIEDYSTVVGGLIGVADTGTTILDSLSFQGDVTGFQRAGGLIGMMHSGVTLTNSFSTGTVNLKNVSGTRFAGGLIGVAEVYGGVGTVTQPLSISKVYSNSSVYGNVANMGSTGDVGGLIGILNSGATLNDSYATGAVYGPETGTATNRGTGGLIGRSLNTATQVSKVYSKGAVTGSTSANQIGGLIGASEITTSASFWDTQSSGQSSSAGGATGKTTSEMKTETTFTNAGWDFSDIWDIDGINNDGYPCFKWKNYPNIPANLNIVFASTDPQLSWEAASGAASYKVYSSINPYAPFPTNWTLEATGITVLNWTDTSATETKKFYIVVAVN